EQIEDDQYRSGKISSRGPGNPDGTRCLPPIRVMHVPNEGNQQQESKRYQSLGNDSREQRPLPGPRLKDGVGFQQIPRVNEKQPKKQEEQQAFKQPRAAVP